MRMGFWNNFKKEKSLECSLNKSRTIFDEDCSHHDFIENAFWV